MRQIGSQNLFRKKALAEILGTARRSEFLTSRYPILHIKTLIVGLHNWYLTYLSDYTTVTFQVHTSAKYFICGRNNFGGHQYQKPKPYNFANINETGGWFDRFVTLIQHLLSDERKVGFLNDSSPGRWNLIHKVCR
jgi:hypothetical protein